MLEFINLGQENMMVKEYSLKFTQLARYAPHVVADSGSKMSKFVFGVSDSIVKECRTAMLIREIEFSRLMVHAQQYYANKRERENKKARMGSFSFSQPRSEGGNRPQFY